MADVSSIASRRQTACATLLREVRAIHGTEGITAVSLRKIKDLVIGLAAHGTALFPDEEFALPEAYGRSHMLDDAANDGFGLYLTVGLPGKEAAPHDHGIWCINAALSGLEVQRFYRRTDDGSRPGFADIEQTEEVLLKPGMAIAMADHDIHSTLVVGDTPARALALYGYALNRFPAVVFFHPQFGTARTCASKRPASRA
jgi:predicted metal-dependent enzyme (double-stranded beta helix superfamily)